MKLNRWIMGFASVTALSGGITITEFTINHFAQPATAFSSPINSTKFNNENVADKPETGNEGSESNAELITTTNANQVPASVTQVGEYGEDLYDAAKVNNWTQANAKLNSLKSAAQRLDNESRINEDPNEDKLDGAIAALDKSVAARQQLTTMREANRVTLLAANLSQPFNPPVPVQVSLLDYYGRQLEVEAAANDINQLNQTARDISQTWNTVRPTVESRGGTAQARKFDNLVARIGTTNSIDGYKRLANSVLNDVDNLEKVFMK